MTKEMKALARKFRAPETSTPEDLECMRFKTLAFGNRTICIGYFYEYGKEGHYTAVYEGKDADCETECHIIAVSDNTFEDEGHAAAWGFAVK